MKPNGSTHEGTFKGIRGRTAALVVALAGIAALAGPAAAQALTLSNLSAQPTDTKAGAHSDFTINMEFDSDDVENLRVGLPPGMIGDPTATPQCTEAELNSSSGCPANTQVGTTTVNATLTVLVVPVTLDIQGKIFNLEPHPGEPARFGIILTPIALDPLPPLLPVVLESAVELRQSDLGLDTVVANIPNMTQGLPTHINSMSLTLQGQPSGGTKPFMRNPTSCDEAVTNFTADAYGSDTDVTGQASFTPTDCDQLDFSPSFSAKIGSAGHTAAGSKPPVSSTISQDVDEAGLKRAKVFLPSNLQSVTSVLSNQCPDAAFQTSTCPAASVVGSAVAASPLLTEPLNGPVILIANPSGFPRIGLDLTGPLAMKLRGDLLVSSVAGIQFDDLPDIPISEFTLNFKQDYLVMNPTSLCDGAPRVFSTDFLGHNGATKTGTTAAALIGCNGTDAKNGATTKPGKKCKKHKKKGKKRAASAKKKRKCKKKRKKRRK
jgi:hypothetical protein